MTPAQDKPITWVRDYVALRAADYDRDDEDAQHDSAAYARDVARQEAYRDVLRFLDGGYPADYLERARARIRARRRLGQ